MINSGSRNTINAGSGNDYIDAGEGDDVVEVFSYRTTGFREDQKRMATMFSFNYSGPIDGKNKYEDVLTFNRIELSD